MDATSQFEMLFDVLSACESLDKAVKEIEGSKSTLSDQEDASEQSTITISAQDVGKITKTLTAAENVIRTMQFELKKWKTSIEFTPLDVQDSLEDFLYAKELIRSNLISKLKLDEPKLPLSCTVPLSASYFRKLFGNEGDVVVLDDAQISKLLDGNISKTWEQGSYTSIAEPMIAKYTKNRIEIRFYAEAINDSGRKQWPHYDIPTVETERAKQEKALNRRQKSESKVKEQDLKALTTKDSTAEDLVEQQLVSPKKQKVIQDPI